MSRFATIDRNNATLSATLKVVGVGGGGCNAVESMIHRGLNGVEYVVVNTDAQVLRSSSAPHKIQVGTTITRGLGAGADPNVGKKSIEEDREKLEDILKGSDMVFITAGMGGGTGTGGAPIVASIARSVGALVVGIVTKPFRWEGKKRTLNAEHGIQELKQYVDSLIVIPNERLLNIVDKSTNAFTAFDKPNEVLYEATRGIADIITVEGLINVDFADVRSVMNQSGDALMGCGIASGENRAIEAAQKAISSPLLDGVNIKGAKSILLNVTGSSNMTINEVNEGNNVIFDAAGEEANVIFGCVKREEMNDYVSYTVIATGFDKPKTTIVSPGIPTKPVDKYSNFGLNTGFTIDLFPAEYDSKESKDIYEPAILRAKGTGISLIQNEDENTNQQGGFQFESLKNFGKELENKKKEEKKDDEEDSSSFLRMMMD